jgi:hypothetical protein
MKKHLNAWNGCAKTTNAAAAMPPVTPKTVSSQPLTLRGWPGLRPTTTSQQARWPVVVVPLMAAAVPATGLAVQAAVRILAVLAVPIRAAAVAAGINVHQMSHRLKGQKVKLKCGVYYLIVDWFDRVTYQEWWQDMSNPACLMYGLAVKTGSVPDDDEVIFGKVDTLGYLVHESELDL